ncbi:protein SDA1 isoform X1 [Capsicum galapagoense]
MSPVSGRHAPSELTAEGISASGLTSEKLSLPILQSKMKCDPEGYLSELKLVYKQFKSSVDLFEQQAALNFTSLSGVSTDPTVSKDLGDRAMFLAHVTPFYTKELEKFPNELANLLNSSARSLPSGLRVHVTQALILLINRKIVDVGETLALFMELQTLGDRVLRKLAFSHVIHSIRHMNQKHKNDKKNRALQNVLFALLQQEDEAKAKRSLITLCELHRRKVWFDDRTANAICSACFHSSSRIMIASVSFLLDYEKIEDDSDSDMSDSEDEQPASQPQVVLNKEAIYKANNKGTSSSKKKKQAKLQRAVRSMKKQQRMQSENNNSSYYSPLNHLKDAQGFAEKLFSRLQTCNERFEVKMMMLKVIARTVGLHHLILLNFYPYLQRYVQPHQRDVTNLLAAAVQACHDMVPPDAVEPLFKQVVNQFVHDRSRPEAISVGLNVIREICLRMPLLMTEDLLQDLVLYRKSNEKAVSAAARSLLTLFREVCPSLLVKKDRGRPTNPKARPKEFGEVSVASSVPGIELLDQDDDDSDDDVEEGSIGLSDHDDRSDENVDPGEEDVNCENDEDNASDDESGADHQSYDECDSDEDNKSQVAEEFSEDDAIDSADATDDDESDGEEEDIDGSKMQDNNSSASEGDDVDEKESQGIKRKISDIDVNAASNSLRALKKLAGAKMENNSLNMEDGILSNEDFKRIKELKAKKDARNVLAQHGFKLPSSDQLSTKRVDAAKLEVNIRKKLSKEERLAIIRAGREDRGRYQAKTALKKKKTGGSSNQQKEHKKFMPIAAKRSKLARSKIEKKRKQQRAGKQFRGRKAWK